MKDNFFSNTEPKMKRLLIYSLAILTLAACGEKIKPGNTEPKEGAAVKATVGTARVTQQPVFYEAVGTLSARTASTVASKLMGVVRAVHVHEGELVKKGDLLVTIDQRQVKAQLDQALANAEIAGKEYRRYQQLLKEQSASQQEFDQAEARYREAQAAVDVARVSQKDAMVRAPYDGLVVTKMIDPGDLASPGTPFVTIEQEGRFCADLVLPERYIQAIKLGLGVKVVVPAMDNQEFSGEVGRIVPSADARSRSFQIKVGMPEGPDFKSGMFARVFIPVGGAGRLLIPHTAIVTEGQLDGIFIVDDQQIARFRLVRTGKVFGDQVEILSGLNDGQRYVQTVPPTLQDGAKVKGES
jgi:RND family efflux transporter MFP subunit